MLFRSELWINQPDGEEHAKCLAEKFLMLSGLTSQAADFGNEFHDVWPNIPRDVMRGLQSETEALFQQAQERISVVLLEVDVLASSDVLSSTLTLRAEGAATTVLPPPLSEITALGELLTSSIF